MTSMHMRVYFLSLAILGIALVAPADINPVVDSATAYICQPNVDPQDPDARDVTGYVGCEVNRLYDCLVTDPGRCPR